MNPIKSAFGFKEPKDYRLKEQKERYKKYCAYIRGRNNKAVYGTKPSSFKDFQTQESLLGKFDGA